MELTSKCNEVNSCDVKKVKQFIYNEPLIYGFHYRFIYYVIGISFEQRPKRWLKVISKIFTLKIITTLLYEIYFTIIKLNNNILVVGNTLIFTIPLVEFNLLHRISFQGQINQLLTIFHKELFYNYNFQMHRSMVNTSKLLSLVFVINLILYYSIGLSVLKDEQSWVYERLFLTKLNIYFNLKSVIASLMYLYETFITNYIPLSVGFYICLFKCFIYYKKSLLKSIEKTNVTENEFSYKLHQLNNTIVLFDSICSFLPFNWLLYCLAVGSIYALSLLVDGSDSTKSNVYTYYFILSFCFNSFFILIVSLIYIINQQEEFEELFIPVLRKKERQAVTTGHIILVDRMKYLFTKQVPVWSICSINRSLIMTYIGSCVTFSTLFIQIQQQGLK